MSLVCLDVEIKIDKFRDFSIKRADAMSKNNPDKRGAKTKLRTYNGKVVKPVLYIERNSRFMAAQYEDGKLVIDPVRKLPIPYKNI